MNAGNVPMLKKYSESQKLLLMYHGHHQTLTLTLNLTMPKTNPNLGIPCA